MSTMEDSGSRLVHKEDNSVQSTSSNSTSPASGSTEPDAQNSPSSNTSSPDQLPDITKLFDYDRIQNGASGFIPVLLWTPIGLILALLRIFIGLHAILIASLLPKTLAVRCFILRTMCTLLGFLVREVNPDEKHKTATRVIVTNYISHFDHLAVGLCLPCMVPCVWNLPKFLIWAFGYTDLDAANAPPTERASLVRHLKEYLAGIGTEHQATKLPVLTHPEGTNTNGKVGLLHFTTWPFSLDVPVQPVILEVHRPSLFPISISILGSRWWSDLFWFLFSPITVFTIKYLQPTDKQVEESIEDFAKRVQREMSSQMNVAATSFKDSDKFELVKRLHHPPAQAAGPRPSATPQRRTPLRPSPVNIAQPRTRQSTQIDVMSSRVKDVLPQVPLDVIRRDLMITANVDETITRILEGTVLYTPIPQPSPGPSTSSSGGSPSKESISLPTPTANNMADKQLPSLHVPGKSFHKSASDRMRSYQDRKATLLEAARIRYCHKFNVTLPSSSSSS